MPSVIHFSQRAIQESLLTGASPLPLLFPSNQYSKMSNNVDRSGFKEVSDAAEERLDKVMKRVIKHDFTKQGGALLELDPFEDHMVSAW